MSGGTMARRVASLEADKPVVSLALRRWLGHTLTDAENRQADCELLEPVTFDRSKLSPEFRTWLGIN